MNQTLEPGEIVEILDLEEDYIDDFVSKEIEAELTNYLEDDSLLELLDETAETEYTCPLCHETFIGKKAIKSHVKRYFKFECKTCGKQYFREKYLARHLRSAHLKSKQLECPICKKIFKAVNNLKQHLHLHSSEFKFVCEYEGCDRKFKQKPGLQQHLRIVHKANTSFCKLCRKRVVDLEKHYELVCHKNRPRKRNLIQNPPQEAKKVRNDSESEMEDNDFSVTWRYSSEEENYDVNNS